MSPLIHHEAYALAWQVATLVTFGAFISLTRRATVSAQLRRRWNRILTGIAMAGWGVYAQQLANLYQRAEVEFAPFGFAIPEPWVAPLIWVALLGVWAAEEQVIHDIGRIHDRP